MADGQCHKLESNQHEKHIKRDKARQGKAAEDRDEQPGLEHARDDEEKGQRNSNFDPAFYDPERKPSNLGACMYYVTIVRNAKTPPFNWATLRTIAENPVFLSPSVRYGVKCWMQSRVVAFGVFFNHSTSIISSSTGETAIGTVPAGCPFRFFGLGGGTVFGEATVEFRESSAFRFFWLPLILSNRAGLVARLPATGLFARL